MRISFIIATLDTGGAQRVLTSLANAWTRKGVTVSVITFDPPTMKPFFSLEKNVNLIHLPIDASSSNLWQSITNTLTRTQAIRRTLLQTRPDAVISFIDTTNIRTIAALLGTGIPLIVSERTDPSKHSIPTSWRILRNLLYPLADRVVIQTKRAQDKLPWSYSWNSTVIPNPVLRPTAPQDQHPSEKHRIVSIGRLVPSKGFDTLIQIFSRLAPRFPDWELVIVGEGPMRAELVSQIARHDMAKSITITGRTQTPDKYLFDSDIFALTSQYEGFPNALCEAMATGLASVAMDCPCGPSELIQNEENGMLVPLGDEAAMESSLAKLMNDGQLRRTLGANAAKISTELSVARVLDMWHSLL